MALSFHQTGQVMIHVVKNHVNASLHAIDAVHCTSICLPGLQEI